MEAVVEPVLPDKVWAEPIEQRRIEKTPEISLVMFITKVFDANVIDFIPAFGLTIP